MIRLLDEQCSHFWRKCKSIGKLTAVAKTRSRRLLYGTTTRRQRRLKSVYREKYI